ncbi:MAG: hypothetical protein R3B53_01170 [Candidatus Paceibacterota bacterium]
MICTTAQDRRRMMPDKKEGGELPEGVTEPGNTAGGQAKALLVVSEADDTCHLSDYQRCAGLQTPDLPVRGLLFNK